MNTTELARAAGVHPLAYSEEYISGLERLVALVRADERERIAAEWDGHMHGDTEDIDIGAAIRARSNT